MKQAIIGYVITALIVGVGAFFGGMEYQKTLKPQRGGNFANLSPEERQKMREQFGGVNGQRFQGRGGNGGFVSGEILSKDDKSITVKLRDGGSKIVFYTETTDVGKFTKGSGRDLEVGKTVMVTGEQNPEGTITAQSIQIRPEQLPQNQEQVEKEKKEEQGESSPKPERKRERRQRN